MQRYQLMRYGQYHASWWAREEVIARAVEFEQRPWWWLRILINDYTLTCKK